LLKWNWRNGEATTAAELGDPTTSTSYAMCIYRRINATEDLGLVLAAEAPAGAMSGTRPSWSMRAGGPIKFTSRFGNAAGLTSISVRPAQTGHTRIKVRGKGKALDLNSTHGVPPVIAQLRASNGTCFEARPSHEIRDRVIIFGDVYEPPFSVDFFAKDTP
jgi:hypothetical protein